MHTGKRTRNIRLKDLKTAYLEQLRERSRARMEEYLQGRTVLESELEECVWDYYRNNPEALASVRAPIYEEKVVDHIISQAKVTDKPVSKDELMKEDDDVDFVHIQQH